MMFTYLQVWLKWINVFGATESPLWWKMTFNYLHHNHMRNTERYNRASIGIND